MVQVRTLLASLTLAFILVGNHAAEAQLPNKQPRIEFTTSETSNHLGIYQNPYDAFSAPIMQDIAVLLESGIDLEAATSVAVYAEDAYDMCRSLGYSHSESIDIVKQILIERIVKEDEPEAHALGGAVVSVVVGGTLLGSWAIATAIADYGDTWGPGSGGKEESGGNEEDGEDGGDSGDGGGSDDGGDGEGGE